jgi:Cu(I)/Ag(I) efflux system membrane protein CusA/SilA
VIKEKVKFPPGYFITWSGQYEYEVQSRKRLMIVVPICIAAIFILLYIKFKSLSSAFILLIALPFAFIGGIWLQFLLGYKFSTAVWVGYIALFGVAVEDTNFPPRYGWDISPSLELRLRQASLWWSTCYKG